MMCFKFKIFVLMALTASTTLAMEPGEFENSFAFLQNEYFYGNKPKDTSPNSLEELGQSMGQCDYVFLDYITHRFQHECALDDKSIVHLLPKKSENVKAKPPIMVKCLRWDPPEDHTPRYLEIIESVKDVVTLLKPIGNATKRHEEGSCVLIFFYTASSLRCSLVAPYANKLAMLFPTLRIAAIDAFELSSFNTEFGIVGLPTLLLFHQGRPIVKILYSHEATNGSIMTYDSFVTRHTGIQPVAYPPGTMFFNGPLPSVPIHRTDYYLVLAWIFIFLCLGNYFAKTRLCTQIVEMIKRNWRESEAQLEHN